VLYGMPTLNSDEKGVRLSVKRMHCNKTEESNVQIFIPDERCRYSLVEPQQQHLLNNVQLTLIGCLQQAFQ